MRGQHPRGIRPAGLAVPTGADCERRPRSRRLARIAKRRVNATPAYSLRPQPPGCAPLAALPASEARRRCRDALSSPFSLTGEGVRS